MKEEKIEAIRASMLFNFEFNEKAFKQAMVEKFNQKQ